MGDTVFHIPNQSAYQYSIDHLEFLVIKILGDDSKPFKYKNDKSPLFFPY
jgi:hypothetical protein